MLLSGAIAKGEEVFADGSQDEEEDENGLVIVAEEPELVPEVVDEVKEGEIIEDDFEHVVPPERPAKPRRPIFRSALLAYWHSLHDLVDPQAASRSVRKKRTFSGIIIWL